MKKKIKEKSGNSCFTVIMTRGNEDGSDFEVKFPEDEFGFMWENDLIEKRRDGHYEFTELGYYYYEAKGRMRENNEK